MDEDTLVFNCTDTEFTIEYDDVPHVLKSWGSTAILRWNAFAPRDTGLPLLKFLVRGVQLKPIFSDGDLRENVQITIIRGVVNTYSCKMTPRTALKTLKGNFRPSFTSTCTESFWNAVRCYLRLMEVLQRKVRIWHNQCTYMLKKFQEGIERAERADKMFKTLLDVELEALHKDEPYGVFKNPYDVTSLRLRHALVVFLIHTLLRSMAEGEALLLSCGELSYNRAALALSSLPPSVPTFSKFAIATRELDWTVDILCCDLEENSRLDNWEWCEERCRLVPSNCTNRLDALADDSLEADVRRQNADREALRASLVQKLSRSHGKSSFKFLSMSPLTSWVRGTSNQGELEAEASLVQKLSRSHGNSSFKFLSPLTSWVRGTSNQGELEAVWRKRLQPSSGSYSPLDAFVIENPETSFVDFSVGSSRTGASKSVLKCKWLGETVSLSTMSNVSKISARAEAGFLARVQHPNVVEWMGYAFKEDVRVRNCYRDCYLVTEHMESDLHDLITEQLTDADGTISTTRPPFDFLVAVDIALQIVEAMIHVHKCRVLHRDIKPKNILASPKYSRPRFGVVPIFYTIKLIDFGSSKMGDEDSHFHSRKQGTTMYMAPEVWESEDSYTWSADVYSFGLTCYEIFHGRLPWESDMPLTFANIEKVMRGKIRFPFAHPEELMELIEKCWSQNPSDRPSFEVIREALWRLKLPPLRKVNSLIS